MHKQFYKFMSVMYLNNGFIKWKLLVKMHFTIL